MTEQETPLEAAVRVFSSLSKQHAVSRAAARDAYYRFMRGSTWCGAVFVGYACIALTFAWCTPEVPEAFRWSFTGYSVITGVFFYVIRQHLRQSIRTNWSEINATSIHYNILVRRFVVCFKSLEENNAEENTES